MPSRAKRNGSADDWTDGGRPKNPLPKTTGNLDNDDKELDNGDIEDDESREDKGKTALMLLAGTPPHPQVPTALFGSTKVFGSTTGGKTQGKTGQGGSAANFLL